MSEANGGLTGFDILRANLTPKQSEGKYRVGVEFNPGGNPHVVAIKHTAAELIDYVLEHGRDPRTAALAATAIEDAAMWAVKSVTKPTREFEDADDD